MATRPTVRIIAVDPGIETGYCYARFDPQGYLMYFPFQMTEDVDDFWRRLNDFKPDIIVMEDFEFRGGHQKSATKIEYFPLQLIGVARLYSLTETTGKCQIFLQKPGQGKGYYTDIMLKNRELYKRGKPHAMDASRHLLQWATFGPGYKYLTKDVSFATLLDAWGDGD